MVRKAAACGWKVLRAASTRCCHKDRVSDAANLVWIMPWDPGLLPHYQRWTASRELCGAIAANVRPTIDPRCRAQVSALGSRNLRVRS